QEALLADPAPVLDQLLMHQGDLPGGTAEGEQANLCPDPRRGAQRRKPKRRGGGRGHQSIRETRTLSMRRPSRSTTSNRQCPLSKASPTFGRWFISARMKPATVWKSASRGIGMPSWCENSSTCIQPATR